MAEWASMIFVFCLLSMSVILTFLTVLSFAEPTNYVKWFTPLHWISRKLWGVRASHYDGYLGAIAGACSLSLLLLVSFVLGGWFVTAAFGLFNSPFSRLVFPN